MCFPLTSICKKQIVAITGLMLVLFIIAHLVGNLFIYGGPSAFNAYAEKLEHLGIVLKVMEYGLLLVFLIHIWFTATVVLENIKARGGLTRYAVDYPSQQRSWATRLMPYSGTYILLYVIWHLFDFTFIDKEGPRSYIGDESYGLYGVVVNAFADPLHAVLYVIAMCFLGLHLAHGVESVIQTLGIKNSKHSTAINNFSRCFAILIVIGFSSIPIYISFFLIQR